MPRSANRFVLAALLLVSGGAAAQAPEKIVFATDWLAQAEHGGFYQAVAEALQESASTHAAAGRAAGQRPAMLAAAARCR